MNLDQELIELIAFIGICFVFPGYVFYVQMSELIHREMRARKMHKQNKVKGVL